MAFKTGELISMNDIINGYMTNVYNPIIQNAYHYDNQPPKDGVYNLIEPERLGKLNQLQASISKNLNNMGSKGGTISAATMVKMMVECTRLLTKVGTWSYIRNYETHEVHKYNYTLSESEINRLGFTYVGSSDNGGWGYTHRYIYIYKGPKITTVKISKNGKALFSDSYIKSLCRNPAAAVTPTIGNLIPITGLNNFFKELLTIWQSTSKYTNSIVITLCHGDCYDNCHNDCYSQSCYKDDDD